MMRLVVFFGSAAEAAAGWLAGYVCVQATFTFCFWDALRERNS